MSVSDKQRWSKVLIITPEIQSSEESDPENPDVIMVKSVPWRASRVSTMFKKMDEKIEETLTPQARRQKRKRVLGSVISTRPQPADTPKWAVAETD